MALFQKSVLKDYLRQQDPKPVTKAYKIFQTYFLDSGIQKNIRKSKEEQFQATFLAKLFVDALGYTLFPDNGYNLTTEYKNEKGAQKADGAILSPTNGPDAGLSSAAVHRADTAHGSGGVAPKRDGGGLEKNVQTALAVIELKSTKTKDLESIRKQAFDYKANHSQCRYVITSNFEKLRFYINDAVDWLEFDLFTLGPDEFALLYLCLHKDNLLRNLPLEIKNKSLLQEEKITKQLYKDYSLFRMELYRDLLQRNRRNPQLKEHSEKSIKYTLFKKTQKLLDRFLFVFFAEDRLLIPRNMIKTINNEWQELQKMRGSQSLYQRYQIYFSDLNQGNRDQDIFAYNGGLFEPDPILDHIEIDDALLYQHTEKLTTYDFESDVDVNILGHIFEHSLNEIESVNAEIEGVDFDKQKARRKKDGVFYTPKYITKYIVDNTLGRLCEEKRNELNIAEEEYFLGRTGRNKKTVEKLNQTLDNYRQWLLQLTICDPACGSGAFLNQALDFLIHEHRQIDEYRAKLLEVPLAISDIENSILENNLFGVDINQESVEIAKLSLWLRTAQRGRKLTSLSNNIKSGNSLIDSVKVAGDKAFKWEKEFPQVFGSSAGSGQGFDVVIGNPPYVSANELKKFYTPDAYKWLKDNFQTAKGTVDLYIYFYEQGLNLLHKNGVLSYITPNRFLSASYGKALREFLVENYQITALLDYSDKKVFPDASTYPVITILQNKTSPSYHILTGKFNMLTKELIPQKASSNKLKAHEDTIIGFLLNEKLPIVEKIMDQSVSLKEIGAINATSTAKEADEYSNLINEEAGYKLINTGTIDPYHTKWGIEQLTDKGRKFNNPYLPTDNKIISNTRKKLYSSPKIVISKIGLQCEAFYDSKGEYASINTNCIHSFNDGYIPEYIVAWLNSKLYNFSFECLFDGLRMSGGYLLYSAPNLRNTFIKKIELTDQKRFSAPVVKLSTVLKTILSLQAGLLNLAISKFDIEVSRRMQNWPSLDFKGFLKELKKAKVKLSLEEEAEWMEYFNKQKAKVQELQAEVDKLDSEIDRMVYQLYELTDEEIKIVEG